MFRIVLFLCSFLVVSFHSSISFALELSTSGVVRATHDGQVIENLKISSTYSEECAIQVINQHNVTIRNIEIQHSNSGICIHGSRNVRLENIRITSSSAPATGIHRARVDQAGISRNELAQTRQNIYINNSPGLTMINIHMEKGSAGAYVYKSPDSVLESIVCEDIRGPYPRGHCVLFHLSDRSSLKEFYAKSHRETSFEGDNINAFDSDHVRISEGLIDGNYSRNGIGVIADKGSDFMTVENVDFVRTGGGAFNVWSGNSIKEALEANPNHRFEDVGNNFTARNIRVKDTDCDGRNGRAPSSGGLVFAIHPYAKNPTVDGVQYWNHCREIKFYCVQPSCFKGSGETFINITERNFELRTPIQLNFPWEDSTARGTANLLIESGDNSNSEVQQGPVVGTKTFPDLLVQENEVLEQGAIIDTGINPEEYKSWWILIGIETWGKEYHDSGKILADESSYQLRELPDTNEAVISLAFQRQDSTWGVVSRKVFFRSFSKTPQDKSENIIPIPLENGIFLKPIER